MDIKQIHHVAYRCRDARETVEFYQRVLGMDFLLAIAEDLVPSTKEPDPYMHVFMDAGNGNIMAFFEVPNSPEMGRDENTPAWVQHIAFEVKDEPTMMRAKEKAEAAGLEVVGPTDHTIIKSIYFFDPNGHRLEITVRTDKPGMLDKLHEVAPAMLEEWSRTKRAPKHAAWLHEGEFEG
jgi:glyoxylase I family protein